MSVEFRLALGCLGPGVHDEAGRPQDGGCLCQRFVRIALVNLHRYGNAVLKVLTSSVVTVGERRDGGSEHRRVGMIGRALCRRYDGCNIGRCVASERQRLDFECGDAAVKLIECPKREDRPLGHMAEHHVIELGNLAAIDSKLCRRAVGGLGHGQISCVSSGSAVPSWQSGVPRRSGAGD